MAQALFYSSNAVAMTLAAGIGSGDVSCTLSTATGLPASFPFKLLIGWSTGQQEVVHCTALAGAVATIVRGQDSTTAQAHSIGASVIHGVSAREFNDLELHVGSTGAVHGLSGNIVGTSDAQALTNKTIDGALGTTLARAVRAAQTSDVATGESSSATSYTDLATSGPAVTVTLDAGQSALLVASANIKGTAGFAGYISYAVSGAETIAASDADGARFALSGATESTVERASIFTATAGGSYTFTAKYRTDSVSCTATWLRRRLVAKPL